MCTFGYGYRLEIYNVSFSCNRFNVHIVFENTRKSTISCINQFQHHARTCLVQMVCTEREFGCNETKIEEEYFIIYVEKVLKFTTSVNIIDEEASAIAHIFEKLFISFHRRFNFLSINKFKTFLKQMLRLTCTFLQSLAQEESVSYNKL